MAYVQIPKDLSKVKTKVIFNLTKRQLICFSSALIIGIPIFILLKNSIGTTSSTFIMIFSMMPFFLIAMYEKHGQPLEIILKHYIYARFINPKIRPYKTNNFYTVMIKQYEIDKEVSNIVRNRKSLKK